jgi:hypothetical protein
MVKLIVKLLALAHLLALRDAKRQAAKQVKYREAKAQEAQDLRLKRFALEKRAQELHAQACDASARAALGCNDINEAERKSRTLAQQLSSFH